MRAPAAAGGSPGRAKVGQLRSGGVPGVGVVTLVAGLLRVARQGLGGGTGAESPVRIDVSSAGQPLRAWGGRQLVGVRLASILWPLG